MEKNRAPGKPTKRRGQRPRGESEHLSTENLLRSTGPSTQPTTARRPRGRHSAKSAAGTGFGGPSTGYPRRNSHPGGYTSHRTEISYSPYSRHKPRCPREVDLATEGYNLTWWSKVISLAIGTRYKDEDGGGGRVNEHSLKELIYDRKYGPYRARSDPELLRSQPSDASGYRPPTLVADTGAPRRPRKNEPRASSTGECKD